MSTMHLHLLLFLGLLAFLLPMQRIECLEGSHAGEHVIGAIVNCDTRAGKEERAAIEIAMDLYKKQRNGWFVLRIKCSSGEPSRAALAARHLIIKNQVHAILGPSSWEEVSAVANVAKQFDIPILSFADSSPSWAARHWPFLVQASTSTKGQMKAVAAIIQSWGWRRVSVMYEDTDTYTSGITPYLYQYLQEVDVQISQILAVPSFADFSLLNETLEDLKKQQCRVFVVHTSLALATRIFAQAKELKMMEKDYVWIITDSIAGMVHSMNVSVISSMQGVLGVRRYFPETGQDFHSFSTTFRQHLSRKYHEENSHEPGIFALEAYDAAWALGLAMDGTNMSGQQILEKVLQTNFDGLTGKINFEDGKLGNAGQYQLINIFGKSYSEHGFWSDGLGFSTSVDKDGAHNTSMEFLGNVVWPGRPWSTPRGWDFPTIPKPLRIGVPNGSLTNKFVKVEYDPSTHKTSFSGFSLEVFNETVKNLEYALPYEFIPFGGNYTDLVKQVQLKKFDAAVGDIAIISGRYDYVEFTHPHTDTGLAMVVPIQSHSSRAWLFMKPFTTAMWLLTVFINLYNGFVIWSIERNYCSEPRGPVLNQIGTLLWLAFATLFSLHGEKLHSNLSRMATIVWLFVALILTQSYTASLTSMLTVQNLEPKISNIETLKSTNAIIGCSKVSFVRGYLETALQFNQKNIRDFTSTDDYAQALRDGAVAAVFLEVPVAKLFVAKYCKSFTIAHPTFNVGGYGFAFPKGSLLLPDMDKALLQVFETGMAKNLETTLISSQKCVDIKPDNETASLSPCSFFVLFIFTGGTSTAVLIIYYVRAKYQVQSSIHEHRRIWMLILMVLQKWKYQRKRFSRKVSDIESPRNSTDNGHE